MLWKKKISRLQSYAIAGSSLLFAIFIILAVFFLLTRFLQDSYKNALTIFTGKRQLLEQKISLEQENLFLKEQLLSLQELKLQAEVTRQPGIAASIIGVALGSNQGTIFIDKGRQTGIREQDWVIAGDKTLIGRVDKTFERFSVVKTVFDPSLKITALVLPENISGLFYFSQGNFVVDLLPQNSTLGINSLVKTSGQDGIFRQGFLLGKALRLEDSKQYPLKQAILEPVFNLNSLTTVWVEKNIFRNE